MEVEANRIAIENACFLLAEDHELNQHFVGKLLKRLGVGTFDIAKNGMVALEKLREKKYDIILMDCHMPEMNGYETTKAIRAMEIETGEHIPIIALTAEAEEGAREKCLMAGMDDYISKPIKKTVLLDVIGQWIIVPSNNQAKENGIQGCKGLPVDMASLVSYSEGDLNEGLKFIKTFVSSASEEINILAKTCADDGSELWVESAQRLKGSAAIIGAEKIRVLCEKAQENHVKSIDERKKNLEDIRVAYDDVCSFFRSENLI